MEDLLQQMLFKLSDISDSLNEISGKLDNISGVYGIDDVVYKMDQIETVVVSAVDDIVGITRSSLSDIESELSSINTTIMLQD